MGRFRIVLVRPAGDLHASALAEAVAYLAVSLRALGHVADSVEVTPTELRGLGLAPEVTLVVACAHLLDAATAAGLPSSTIVLNSEPLEGPAAAPPGDGAYRALLARCHAWDYSPVHLAQVPHASVIPFWYRPELACADLPRSPRTHVLFYGVVTPSRHRTLRHLAAHGVPLDIRFGVYGAERDRLMRGALAVLNLHKTEDARLFEPIRCFHPLISGVPVISEDTTDPAADPFRTAVSFLPTAGLVRAVVGLLADRAAFEARAQAQLAAFAILDALPAIAEAVARYVSCTSTSTRPRS